MFVENTQHPDRLKNTDLEFKDINIEIVREYFFLLQLTGKEKKKNQVEVKLRYVENGLINVAFNDKKVIIILM